MHGEPDPLNGGFVQVSQKRMAKIGERECGAINDQMRQEEEMKGESVLGFTRMKTSILCPMIWFSADKLPASLLKWAKRVAREGQNRRSSEEKAAPILFKEYFGFKKECHNKS